jgi:MFS family permease
VTVKEETRDRIWSIPFILILTISLLVSTGHYMLMSTLPLYVVRLSGNRSMAGLMVTMLALSALAFRPYFGNLMDRRGRKLVLVVGAGLLMATALLYNFITALSLLFLIRFFQGAGFSAHTTSSGTIVADILPASRLSEGIGYFGIANTVATAIGPFLGLYSVERFGYQALFIWVFSLSLLSFLSTLLVNYEKKLVLVQGPGGFTAPIPKSVEKAATGWRLSFIEASSIRPSLIMFFIALTFGAIITYVPSFGIARSIDNIGIFFTVYAGAVLVSRTFSGRLADQRGFTRVLIPGMAALSLSLVVLAFSYSLPMVILAGALYGFGYGTCYPLSNAIVIRLCPKERRGAATATIFAAMDLGIGIGAFLWGWVAVAFGYTAVFLGASACVLASFWVYMALVLKRIPGETELFRSRVVKS